MRNKFPLKVGITGGIGAGKSTVTQIFSILGIPVYHSDDRAKWLMANDPNLSQAIKQEFGAESFLPDGSINRIYLSEKIFNDREKIAKINSLVHPVVFEDFLSWTTAQNSPYVLKEAALIFETGGHKQLDFTINVSSPLKIRMARILLRDEHRSEEQVNHIINHQMPDEEKNALADAVIKNTDNKLLIPQVLHLHEKLIKQAAAY
jgi:dephospho-CoA kinase